MDDRKRRYDFKALQIYACRLQDRMGLRDWVVCVVPDEPDDGSTARVLCVYGQRVAFIAFADHYFDLPPERQRAVLVHELVHPHLDVCARLALPKFGDDGEPFLLTFEHGVDAVAQVIAPFMPLPARPFRPRRRPRG